MSINVQAQINDEETHPVQYEEPTYQTWGGPHDSTTTFKYLYYWADIKIYTAPDVLTKVLMVYPAKKEAIRVRVSTSWYFSSSDGLGTFFHKVHMPNGIIGYTENYNLRDKIK